MSVTEICARIDPSTYSTSECTVDCGCTVTRTLSGGTSKSRQASMISSPLFSMVAESIVIRRPITHVGCFKACSGVMPAKSASGVFRNGPPEAVSQIVFTSACAPTRMHWCTALCSLSMGRIGTLRSRAAAVKNLAGRNHALLVGQAHRLSGQDRRMRCLQPRDAHNGRDHKVRFRMRRAGHRSLPCRGQPPCPLTPASSQSSAQVRPQVPPSPAKRPSAASARPAQRPRRRCGRLPASPPRSARETAQQWRGCFGRWSRWNREWRVVSTFC